MADSKLDREFLRSILTLAAKPAVDHLLMVTDVPLSKDDIRGRPIKKKIIYAVSEEQLAHNLRKQGYVCVTVPPYDYSRIEKVKVALVAAVTADALRDGEDVLCLTGRTGSRLPDTVVRLQIGRGFEEKSSIDTQGLGDEFSPQVVEALVSLAMAIGHEGFEGHPIGTIFVLGESTTVMEHSKQLTINPFQGISEAERNVLDPSIREAIKNFAVLDGAFIIREDGVVLAAGRYLQVGEGKVELPLGLGARHAAAAAITVETNAVAISVSQSSGTVRVWKGGQAVLELQPVDILGVDAAILFSDILVVCEAMGMKLILEDEGPQFPTPLRTQADVDRLHIADPERELGYVMEAIRRTLKGLGGRVPLIGFCGGRWTLGADLIGGKTSSRLEPA